jgi:hypothetical protein
MGMAPPSRSVDWCLVKRLVVVAAVGLVASACGGGGTPTYAKAPTVGCLTGKGVRVSPVSQAADFVAWSAEGGSFRATVPGNFVTVSFGLTVGKANAIADAYRRFAAANVGVSDVLRQQGNAVMLWHVHPSDTDATTITSCLKS